MVSATIILLGIVFLLLILNFLVSLFPKKNQPVKVAFIPPTLSPTPPDDQPADWVGMVQGHMHANNTKITQLFSRVEDIERRLLYMEESLKPAKEEAWIETVPVRNKKK